LNNLEAIRSVSAEGVMLGRWEKHVGMSADAALRSRFFSNLVSNVTGMVMAATSVVVVIIGVYLIEARELTMGALIACTILTGRAMAPLGQITGLLTRYQMTKLALKTLDHIMELPSERPLGHQFLHRPHFQGEVEFEDVSFKYPGQPMDMFKGISFKVKAGERLGILGSMGAGKTTLQKLIMGFYEPYAGAIRIDGTDIAQIDPANLRRHIAYIPQEPQLFYGTVRENIAMKAPWADDETILKSSKLAGADSFIGRHPAGYDMPVGEGGQGLSGGQAQAITVARAMLLDPPILLFDEPTSSMDSSAERQFIQRMLKNVNKKTLIIVTHRMPLLELVNRLIVLKNGRIIADGTKERVLEALKQLKK
jgi:ATP-binding cassette, subfamily C, bacterial LapB